MKWLRLKEFIITRCVVLLNNNQNKDISVNYRCALLDFHSAVKNSLEKDLSKSKSKCSI